MKGHTLFIHLESCIASKDLWPFWPFCSNKSIKFFLYLCYVFYVQIHHLKSQTSVECLLSHFKVSNSVQPRRRQPTRLPHPWDSPGKNTGVGCHFLLKCMKVKSQSEVAQSYPTLSDPWTAAYQAPLSMGFSRQEYWSGLPLPSLLNV